MKDERAFRPLNKAETQRLRELKQHALAKRFERGETGFFAASFHAIANQLNAVAAEWGESPHRP